MEQSHEEDVMYCIISLPRTASTFTWHQINAGLVLINPIYQNQPSHSIFNPRYNTEEQIVKKYSETLSTNPLPLIKIISNHNFSMVEDIINSQYKTVFIKPKDLRKQILKTLVAKKTDSFAIKETRNKFKGLVTILPEEIEERIDFYNQHMSFESRCDYSFFDSDILATPTIVNEALQIPVVKSKYKYKPPTYTDEEMLSDIRIFNELFEVIYERKRR